MKTRQIKAQKLDSRLFVSPQPIPAAPKFYLELPLGISSQGDNIILDKNGEQVANCEYCLDAEYIVRIVNSHTALLEAAIYAACPACQHNKCENLRQAIARAEVK